MLFRSACGLRVIGGQGGGTADAIPDERVGAIVDPADRDAFVLRFLAGPVQLPWLRDVLARGSSLGEPSPRMKLATRSAAADVPRFEPRDGAALPLLGDVWRLQIGRGNNRVVWHEAGPEPVMELALRAGGDARQLLLRGLQERALAVFCHRVEEFCLRLGRPVPAVGLSSARTRWGSCSVRSGIRLHWRLIHLPLPLIDYVVAHEVAHLVEMNHSPRFWSVVTSLYPEHAAARQALRKASAALPAL